MRLIYIPPNCTSHVQPLDQGIMYSVKARYRKWYLRWLLTQTSEDAEKLSNIARLKPDLREGIVCVAEIWDSIPDSIIRSSWARANVFLVDTDDGDTHTPFRNMQEEDTEQVNAMIVALNQPQPIPAQAYINCDDVPTAQVQDPTYFLTGGDEPTNPSSDNPSADSSSASLSGRSPSTSVSSEASIPSHASSVGTEELNLPVQMSDALQSLKKAKRFFEDAGLSYDVSFVFQVSRMINAIEEKHAEAVIRQAVRQSDIRAYFA